jgi:hypothetical protein
MDLGSSKTHPALSRVGTQRLPKSLYVVTAVSNPQRWATRIANYWDFEKHITDSGAILYTVELALGVRPFDVTSSTNPQHVQLRTQDALFHKENLENLGMHRLPADAEYVAFIDADMIFTRPDWVQETLHKLQHFDVVQMFSNYADLGPDHRLSSPYPSYMFSYWNDPNRRWLGAPGGAWAYRVSALRTLGGLMDRCILGAGDYHMAEGLVQRDPQAFSHPETKNCPEAYRSYIAAWKANAAKLNKNIGYVDALMVHKFHGTRAKRAYDTRWKVLLDHQFDPYRDIQSDHQGVYMLTGDKPGLRDVIRKYFNDRDEDATSDPTVAPFTVAPKSS